MKVIQADCRRSQHADGFRQLRHFEAVARAGSLTRAADTLGLTVPALSKSIRALEQALGEQLLERGPRGVQLTTAGRMLLGHATLATNLMAGARRVVQELHDPTGGSVRIGAAPGAAQSVLPGAVAALRGRLPRARISVQEGLFDLPQAVQVGDLDLALIASAPQSLPADLHCATVFSERVVVVGAAGLSRRGTLAALQREHWVLPALPNPLRVHLDACFRAAGDEPPAAVVESGSMLFVTALLRLGGLFGYLPESVCRADLAARRLVAVECPALNWRRDIVVVWHRQLPLPPAAAALLDVLRQGFTPGDARRRPSAAARPGAAASAPKG